MVLGVSIAVLINMSLSGTFPKEGTPLENLESAISENLPFREKISDLMDGIRYISGVRHFGDIYIGTEGSLLREIEKPTSRTYSAAKNYILSFAEKNQIKPYFMLIPTASVILKQEVDSYAAQDIYNQRNIIARMYSEFEGGVRTADVYQTLYDHRGEYIYYHTEDLPTSLGGYYIYGELCSRLDLRQNTIDSFSAAYVAHGFYGSLATDFLRPNASADFVTFYEYIGEQQNTVIEHFDNTGVTHITEGLFIYNEDAFEDKTDMIFGGISPKMEITSSKSTGERNAILIFGDEAAKSWLPFLASNYGRITFIDLNSAEAELLGTVSAGDYDQILFAYSTATFSSGIAFEKLEYIG